MRERVSQIALIEAINRELSRQGFALLTPKEFGVVIDCATRLVDAIGPPHAPPDVPAGPRPVDLSPPAADATGTTPGASSEGVSDAD